MTFQLSQLTTHRARRALALCAVALLGLLYLADLTGMGMASKDEPRYADIGRAMARSGDWITPRLWGEPWFEKPALLYWLIGAGFKLGLSDDLAPRLPVALLSLAFLGVFWWRVRIVWDERSASYSTAILATTAGWLAYSHVAVTDVPLAAFFSVAVLFSLSAAGRADRTIAAAALGFAVLAKSLVPLVLFIPVVALDWRRLGEWLRPAPLFAFLVVVLPWHILCALRNGGEFFRVLVLQQQFGRFFSPELQHVRPLWYYVPILLLLLYPWFPLLANAARDWRDRRVGTLIAVALFGFVFFSASLNKLPGYLLPLVPSLCILMGLGLARSSRPQRLLAMPVALLALLPFALGVVPPALGEGLRRASIPWATLAIWIPAGALAGTAVYRWLGTHAVAITAGVMAVAFMALQAALFPAIDRTASARPLWLASHPRCVSPGKPGLSYGLYYYSGHIVLPCTVRQPPMTQIQE